ncbi:hypothetical protein GJR96_04520 [Haloferax sp. MBLA0076]|uniref:Restriction endonuclease type IV Mrr domain-containing protein n=1 Tax=Haloferax litoreum TaxID=2666140 RepID=A0A6A8GDH3_9EURY|nr:MULTISPECIES: hypothetical protein [Haloferax]KAB1192743.1 hypothetical protein Hfx1148_04510 [Haloferax sp. CBA1148]MRX21223.1 hypothetical protein [Haloferax litoreum]
MTEGSKVPDIFANLDSIELVFDDGTTARDVGQSKGRTSANSEGSPLKPTTKRSIPSPVANSYPELSAIFESGSYYSQKRFDSYVRKANDSRLVSELLKEIFQVLGYSIPEQGIGESATPLTATKGERNIAARVFYREEVDHIDLSLCRSLMKNESVTSVFVVIVESDVVTSLVSTTSTNGIRVIDQSEFQELVEGAVLRITEVSKENS